MVGAGFIADLSTQGSAAGFETSFLSRAVVMLEVVMDGYLS